jgi:hypothetical protein
MARVCASHGAKDCKACRRPSKGGAAWGAEHQRRREAMLRSTPEICGRCGQGPRANDPWEAGHIVAVALGGGPEVRREHRSCNRRHGAQLRHELKKAEIERKAELRIKATIGALR